MEDGCCERCHTQVVRRNLTQWFFKITDYAEELLSGLKELDWPERIKAMQTNWIGRSEAAQLTFDLEQGGSFAVFTTRPDTLCGNTYCVLAPEHPLVDSITTPEQAGSRGRLLPAGGERIGYRPPVHHARKDRRITGSYAINPSTAAGAGVDCRLCAVLVRHGRVMAVPAHDERDYAFAQKYDLPIERVIQGPDDTRPSPGPARCATPKRWTAWIRRGQACHRAEAGAEQSRRRKIYRMRDWLISRQRYWGAPIPMIHCPHCGVVPVPEDQLPVLLPYDVDFTPDGTSPLLKHEGFMNVKCPVCGADAKRDPIPWTRSLLLLVLPALSDCKMPRRRLIRSGSIRCRRWTYIGGAEHACMHLLYARFLPRRCAIWGW